VLGKKYMFHLQYSLHKTQFSCHKYLASYAQDVQGNVCVCVCVCVRVLMLGTQFDLNCYVLIHFAAAPQ
jgi:hypothetical protein